ncbi:MAG: LacI family transcriptional regulator [Clostridia bacterium]|nr:LacI family transcriptional regulator [Clostridia bacterium]
MTIREIATMAGVSPAAVSLVLNNKKGVSEDTRRRVQSCIDENGYALPSQRRKGKRFRLALVKYRTHGIAIEENQGFIASIIDQIEAECRRFAFDLVMWNCEAKTAELTLRELMGRPPDGVIFIGTELGAGDHGLLRIIDSVPLVVLDNSMAYEDVDSVVMDNAHIAAAATRYLYELGHRHIGYFKFDISIRNCEERYEGYLRELRRLGLQPPPPVLLRPTLGGSYEEMKRLLRDHAYVPAGAVVSDNDTVALGAVKAIREAGYRIPEDMSIIGVDDSPFSAVAMPALTTMRISRAALGTLAVDTIRRRITQPDWPGMHVQITGSLVVRSSARPVGEAPGEAVSQ